MSLVERSAVRTASKEQSVWRYLSETTIRKHMVALEKTSNEVPEDPKEHSLDLWRQRHRDHDRLGHSLPMASEKRIADDIAFVAASKDNVKAVSAVGLEEHKNQSGMIIRLAANDHVAPETAQALTAIFGELSKCASRRLSRAQCSDNLFSKIILLCEARIHARLESIHWKKPKHLYGKVGKPLHISIRELIQRLHTLPANDTIRREDLYCRLNELREAYKAIDDINGDNERLTENLKIAVRKSHEFSTNGGERTLENTISSYGFNPSEVSQDKHIRQINKVGRYWGFCVDTPKDARKYRNLFQHIVLKTIPPYMPVLSNVFFKATKKASVKCNVHAEIQLLLHYDLDHNADYITPRVLGVSKSACYLCNLFILEHGRFFHTKTHGRLFDQWTVPDLAIYSEEQRTNYRRIMAAMDREIMKAIPRQRQLKRQHPGNSWISLQSPPQTSPVGSDEGTLLSEGPRTHSTHSKLPPDLHEASRTHPVGPSRILPTSQTTLVSVLPRAPDSPSEPLPPSRSLSRPPLPSPSDPQPRLAGPSLAARPSSPLFNSVPPVAPTPPTPASIHPQAPLAGQSSSSSSPAPSLPSEHSSPLAESPLPSTQRTLSPPRLASSNSPSSLSPSSSDSTLSFNPDDHFKTKIITPGRPLHLASPGISTVVEVEAPSTGHVRITPPAYDKHDLGFVVDLDTLLPNEKRSFYREENASGVLLCFHRRHKRGIQLEMTWP